MITATKPQIRTLPKELLLDETQKQRDQFTETEQGHGGVGFCLLFLRGDIY